MRILVCVDPVDFRCGIDGLARICRQKLSAEPFSGTLFAFINRRRTAIKCLVYDSQGFCLFHKRLSEKRFVWWPCASDSATAELAVHEMQLLLWNGDTGRCGAAPVWRRLEKSPGVRIGVRRAADTQGRLSASQGSKGPGSRR